MVLQLEKNLDCDMSTQRNLHPYMLLCTINLQKVIWTTQWASVVLTAVRETFREEICPMFPSMSKPANKFNSIQLFNFTCTVPLIILTDFWYIIISQEKVIQIRMEENVMDNILEPWGVRGIWALHKNDRTKRTRQPSIPQSHIKYFT